MTYPILRLNPRADYRINHGHLWIYSNEIDNQFFALKNLQLGDLCVIANAQGKSLGLAYVNPNTLICGRILHSDPNAFIDASFFNQRIKTALSLRQQIFDSNFYRLVFGEGDYLPGLVIDRFNDTLVVQIATAGMERYIDLIVNCLDMMLNPVSIVIKNDGKMRAVEGLPTYVTFHKGAALQTISIEENGVKFIAPIMQGQKTGWFYDHRLMRARLKSYARDLRVLDLFSYVGGWGIQAAAFGAREVVCSDISDTALAYVADCAKLNNLQNVKTIVGDAFDVMQDLITSGEKFDMVILDPPAFIPRRKDLHKGMAAYLKANTMACKLLNTGGFLVSGSCSLHLPVNELRAIMHKGALKAGRKLQFLEQGHQGPDHPIHPSIAETEYLKSFIAVCD